MTTQNERQDLAREFKGDLLQMQRCLKQAGYEATDDELVLAWSTYSKSLCAGWLSLPGEQDLLQILLRQLSAPRLNPCVQHYVDILAAQDASHAAVIGLPTGVLERLGWRVGNKIMLSVSDDGHLLIARHQQ